MGEGSGCIILEELGHARARGARVYAEVVSIRTACNKPFGCGRVVDEDLWCICQVLLVFEATH